MDSRRPWVLRGLVIGIAVVVGVVVYLVAGSGDDGEEPAPDAGDGIARIVSEDELADLASTSETPVYWAGEMEDTELEVSQEESNTLVRYLEEEDKVGAALGQRIAVGTYAQPNPRKAVDNLVETPGWKVKDISGVGKVAISPGKGTNLYFASPDNEVQVEVYAPSSERAIELIRSGQVQPID